MITFFKRCLLGISVGLIAGLSSTFFLYTLQYVTQFRQHNLWIIFLLPVVGIVLGIFYQQYGQGQGIQPILNAAQDGQTKISKKSSTYIFLGTLITHLFGGSTGREGTAIQMSAGFCDLLIPSLFKITIEERKTLLQAAIGAGFASAIGVPLAGFVFALEIFKFRRIISLWECFLAALFAVQITSFFHAPHMHFARVITTWAGWKFLFVLFFLSISIALLTRIYLYSLEKIEQNTAQIKLPIKMMLGGLFLCIGYYFLGAQFAGLGIDSIQNAFLEKSPFLASLTKGLFTVISLGSGFKGGDFIPLVFMGSTLGSAFSSFTPEHLSLITAIGFIGLFASASKTPIACTILAMELFGPSIAVYCLPVYFLSAFVSGKKTLYPISLK